MIQKVVRRAELGPGRVLKSVVLALSAMTVVQVAVQHGTASHHRDVVLPASAQTALTKH